MGALASGSEDPDLRPAEADLKTPTYEAHGRGRICHAPLRADSTYFGVGA